MYNEYIGQREGERMKGESECVCVCVYMYERRERGERDAKEYITKVTDKHKIKIEVLHSL